MSLPPKFRTLQGGEQLKGILKEKIDELLQNGVTHFITGMAMGVDIMAAEIILELKKENPEITLECAIPCKNQCNRWQQIWIARYNEILKSADSVNVLSEKYTKSCMMDRNKYMVDNSQYVIAVWNGKPSGTGNTIKYANKKGKEVIIIDPENIK